MFGVEVLRGAAWLLALGAVVGVVMAGAAVWNGAPDDVDAGAAPGAPAKALFVWLAVAVVATAAAATLWTMLPEPDDELEID